MFLKAISNRSISICYNIDNYKLITNNYEIILNKYIDLSNAHVTL